MLATPVPAAAQQQGDEDVDHAGIIRAWSDKNRERGRKIYDSHCYGCHGYDGDARLPDARSFRRDELRAGSDPYSMWRTLTEGFGQMVPQIQYTPEERYDVVHFIREVLMRDRNREQYFEVTDEYLASLPVGTPRADLAPPEGHPRDFGPVLTSQFRREVNRAMTFDLGEDVFVTYDLHRMRQHHAWEGFLNLTETQHMRYRGERQPYPEGEPLDSLQTYHWAYGEDFDAAPENSLMAGLENGKSMGPTDPELMLYNGHYLDGRTATLSFAVHGREILERPRAHRGADFLVLENLIRVAPGPTPLRLVVGEFAGDPGTGRRAAAARRPPRKRSPHAGPARDNIVLAAEHAERRPRSVHRSGHRRRQRRTALGGDRTAPPWPPHPGQQPRRRSSACCASPGAAMPSWRAPAPTSTWSSRTVYLRRRTWRPCSKAAPRDGTRSDRDEPGCPGCHETPLRPHRLPPHRGCLALSHQGPAARPSWRKTPPT